MTLSLDMNVLIKAVKRAAIDAVKAQKPMTAVLGEVVSVNPLQIQIDQKMTLSAAQLILTSAVRDFDVDITSHDGNVTETANGHIHAYKGKKRYTIHLALEKGEKVLLLRCDGGQRYIILDRWEAAK